MRKLFQFFFLLITAFAFAPAAFAQTASQTVRGTVLDAGAKAPVIGATVVVLGLEPALGTTTDVNGRFRLVGVPVGRVKLRVSWGAA